MRKKWQDDLDKDRDEALDELAEQITGADLSHLKKMNAGVKRRHEDSEDEDDFVDASDMMDDDDDFLSPESKVLISHQTHIFFISHLE